MRLITLNLCLFILGYHHRLTSSASALAADRQMCQLLPPNCFCNNFDNPTSIACQSSLQQFMVELSTLNQSYYDSWRLPPILDYFKTTTNLWLDHDHQHQQHHHRRRRPDTKMDNDHMICPSLILFYQQWRLIFPQLQYLGIADQWFPCCASSDSLLLPCSAQHLLASTASSSSSSIIIIDVNAKKEDG